MKNYSELFSALLAGETLTRISRPTKEYKLSESGKMVHRDIKTRQDWVFWRGVPHYSDVAIKQKETAPMSIIGEGMTHEEMFKALLAGETLITSKEEEKCKLVYKLQDGILLWKTLADDDDTSWTPCGDTVYPKNVKIKEKTININGFEVPEPLKTLSGYEKYQIVHCVDLTHYENTIALVIGECIEPGLLRLLAKGLLHSSRQSASIHAIALLSFT